MFELELDYSYPVFERYLRPLDEEEKLLFFHLERTAGTTVHNILSMHFRQRDICPARLGDIELMMPVDLADFKYFAPHSSVRMLRFLPRPIITVSFFRNPVERLWSHYNSFRFLRDDIVKSQNLMHIHRMSSLEPSEFFNKKTLSLFPAFWNLYAHRLGGDLFVSSTGRPWIDKAEMLDHALASLDSIAIVGITEYIDISMQCLAEDLSVPNLYDGHRLNGFDNKPDLIANRFERLRQSDLTDQVRDLLGGATQLDEIIYAAALRRFEERLARGFSLTCLSGSGLRTEKRGEEVTVRAGANPGYCLYGPYVKLPRGSFKVTMFVSTDNSAERSQSSMLIMDVSANSGKDIYAKMEIQNPNYDGGDFVPLELSFDIPESAGNIEFRLYSVDTPYLSVNKSVEIRRIGV